MNYTSVQVPAETLALWRAQPDLWLRRAGGRCKAVNVERFAAVVLRGESMAAVARAQGVTREAVRQSVARVQHKLMRLPKE